MTDRTPPHETVITAALVIVIIALVALLGAAADRLS